MQDVYTAGPGESVLCQLRSIENLLTVGAPTAGAMLTGNPVSAYLPHSGLELVWGTKIQQLENGWLSDGEGIPPDLWVPAEEALARIEAMIGYYGLRTGARRSAEQPNKSSKNPGMEKSCRSQFVEKVFFEYFLGAAHASLSVAKPWSASEVR